MLLSSLPSSDILSQLTGRLTFTPFFPPSVSTSLLVISQDVDLEVVNCVREQQLTEVTIAVKGPEF